MKQEILRVDKGYLPVDWFFVRFRNGQKIRRVMLVSDLPLDTLEITRYFRDLAYKLEIGVVLFNQFKPNPDYESVVAGVRLYKESGCDAIVAIGGGSSMDVAKCIKMYATLDENRNYLEQEIIPNDIPFLAVPTTAGTGSEATRFAIVYYQGKKQSITHESCIPNAVIVDPRVLETLPEYQRKATMLDALCHAIESYWAVSSTEESRRYSAEAIKLIFGNVFGYLANNPVQNEQMMRAAYLAGKAINITRTTAPHAFGYNLTSVYGVAHGHAVALCMSKIFPLTVKRAFDRCNDPRGAAYLEGVLREIARLMGCNSAEAAAQRFGDFVAALELRRPQFAEGDYSRFMNTVNPERLKNHPVVIDEAEIEGLYREILA